MLTNKKSERIIERVKEEVYDLHFMSRNKVNKKDFTRKRKLPFVHLVLFMLNLVKHTLQKELTEFIRKISKGDVVNVTKSAFCQSRVKLKPEAFIELNDVLVKEFYTDNDEERFNGFRLLAIDTSTLDLPISNEIIETFGTCPNTGKVITPKARASFAYDVLNNIMIDSRIGEYKTGEYSLALKNLNTCKNDDLIIFDRGFGAIWFMYYLHSKKINFVIRIQKKFTSQIDKFWESEDLSRVIKVSVCPEKSKKNLKERDLKFEPFKIKLIKVILDNGETEVLATSIIEENNIDFKKLYFKRWGVETNIGHLKNHIEIENFSGKSEIAIKQDFYANLFINNIQSIIARDVMKEIQEKKQDAEYTYKVNRNLSLAFLKDRIIDILISDNPKYMDEIKDLFRIEPVPIREGRKNPREYHKWRRKHHMNNRRAL